MPKNSNSDTWMGIPLKDPDRPYSLSKGKHIDQEPPGRLRRKLTRQKVDQWERERGAEPPEERQARRGYDSYDEMSDDELERISNQKAADMDWGEEHGDYSMAEQAEEEQKPYNIMDDERTDLLRRISSGDTQAELEFADRYPDEPIPSQQAALNTLLRYEARGSEIERAVKEARSKSGAATSIGELRRLLEQKEGE